MKVFKKIANSNSNILSDFAAVGLAIMFFTLIIQIFLREVIGYNLIWVIELNQILFQFITFIEAANCVLNSNHIRFSLISDKFKGKFAKTMKIILMSISLIFYLIVSVSGYKITEAGKYSQFSTMPISYFWLYLPTFIFGVLAFITTIMGIIHIFTFKGDGE